ncbi:thioester reductase domain-containing protein [Streptomyces rhizosphaerihabitans]|uniref:thioester reductase domain-containing protein n=1 Tax=Streptomyces rhizosphaerihabitans TaxID=1266770 RepID=UPI0021C17C94|nr:thioester reductase domain-containing protein [Streptomyces rhizosphaerihabitans]MCT9007321.1 thioester reductase domain-containing protein [Streptomyces rhizosphaerihabitans]
MREVNEDAAAHAGQRATGEAIERGDGGPSVEALLARIRQAPTATPTPTATGTDRKSGVGTDAGARADTSTPRVGEDADADAGKTAVPSGAVVDVGAPAVSSGAGADVAPPGAGTDLYANAPTVPFGAGAGAGTGVGGGGDTGTGTDRGAGALPALAVSAAPAAPAPDADGLAAVVAAAAGPFVPGGQLSPDTDFFDAGGTSVGAVELVAALEDELGMEIDLDEVFADARPRSLALRWLVTAGATAALSAAGAPATPTAAGTPAPAADTIGTAPAPGTFPFPVPAAAHGFSPAPAPGFRPALAPASSPAPATDTPSIPSPRIPSGATVTARTTGAGTPYATARPEDLDQILADLSLADRLPWTGSPEPLPPRRILLTGATGFLGSHLLLDLLRHSDAHVHCLVRAADEEAATARLGEALKSHRLPWSSEIRRRVTVLPGDIRRPHLGLSDDVWNKLAHEVDSVVGVAAAVDFLRGYQSLRQSNVIGALTLAELAATGPPKPLHHISSIAVFNEVGIASMGEDDPLAHVDRLVAGYDQTKWAAEVALRRARDHGLIVTAMRPGGIGGHTRTGAHNPQDLSSGLISAFGRFRTVPAFHCLNAAPVDWVSRVAAGVICEPDAWGFDYNLTGVPNTLDDVVRDMAYGGMHVRVQDWDEWRTDALARLEADPVPELGFLTRVLRSPTALKLCEATLKGPAATGERTAALVEALGLRPAARYDAQAQLRTFERLARDGLARLPDKGDQPYLWFSETTEGDVGPVGGGADTPCSMALTLSIASMYQLVKERRVDVGGELVCAAAHPAPLLVEHGDVWIRPEEGIPQRHGMRHQLLRYRLTLRDADGGRWWLEGHKYARARRDVWRQTRALNVEIGREGEPASFAGELVVPADSYVRDQIDGIKVDPRLTGREKRVAKLTWLAWFGAEMGRGLLGPFTRAAADLLDLRRTRTPSERPR